jgi:hypothetical protein
MRRAELFAVVGLAAASVAAAWALPRPAPISIALIIPILWGGLFLYLPARAASWWCWRQVEFAAPNAEDRRALALVLALGFGLLIWGIDWGLASRSWAPDELRADWVRDVLDRGLSSGWYDKYPWLHYAVLGIPVSAFELAERFGILAPGGAAAWSAQLFLMRAVSVLMGLGTLVASFLCAVELTGARHAVLAPLVLLLTPVFLYYGKLANVDVPSLCWFGWAMVAFLRVLRGGVMRDYLWLGIAAAGSIATKDQAYASLGLAGVAAVVVTARRLEARTWWEKLGRVIIDRRIAAAAAASVLAFAAFHNLLFNFAGFVSHVRLLLTHDYLGWLPREPASYLSLAGSTLSIFRWAFGWPLSAVAALGILGAVVRRERRWHLWLLAVPFSFYLLFTCVTMYVTDRFLLGGIFVLALFAGTACRDLITTARWQPIPRLAVAAACTYALAYAASINVMMDVDSRHVVRRWIAERARPGTVVAVVGGAYAPIFDPPARVAVVNPSVEAVEAVAPDFVVLNARYAERFEADRSPDGRVLMRALETGALGVEEALRYRAPVPAWAVLQYEPPMRSTAESLITNLDKVNPEMVVYHRKRR